MFFFVHVLFAQAQAQQKARNTSIGPPQDAHLWSPVGPVKYAGQEYVQQCGSVTAHHHPDHQILNIPQSSEMQIQVSNSAASAESEPSKPEPDTNSSTTKSSNTLVDLALSPSSLHMPPEQEGDAESGASTAEQGRTPNSVMSANPSNVPSASVSGDASPGESSPNTSFSRPPLAKISAPTLASKTPLETGSC